MTRIQTTFVLDAFAASEAIASYLPVIFSVPLLDGGHLIVTAKSRSYDDTSVTQTWHVRDFFRQGNVWVQRWDVPTDWKPLPYRFLETPYQCAITHDVVWAPGQGGTLIRIQRSNGRADRVNPFNSIIDSNIHLVGSPVIDGSGNVSYMAIQLDPSNPWTLDAIDSWLIKVSVDGTISRARVASLVRDAPPPIALCTSHYDPADLPFPPAPDAKAPAIACGSQRPALNASPAVDESGVTYFMTRAHFNDRWANLVAVNPDLTPRWTVSLRNRFVDGCGVVLPPDAAPGGCRDGAAIGVDPEDNEPGSGRVSDDSTASPVIAPNGDILYAAFSRYNYSQGHLMRFASTGDYLGAYGGGWDSTPAVFGHDDTFSIIFKENHYNIGSYCDDEVYCPFRNNSTPDDAEAYFITQLDKELNAEWKFRNTTMQRCVRAADGRIGCSGSYPHGFDWCVSAVAVDATGVVFANSADGNLYAVGQGGVLRGRVFLDVARGAAYTPLAIDGAGDVLAMNDGKLFVVGGGAVKRAVRH
jgi:hypothetical protein